ncbi:MAG: hypothetical protein IPJ61_00580 [Tessaracoccus sp.]|uniref:hypothetical protein n=1 Tax=Tessaracoccus sp. TaxID=1971211 RepID=UPI001EB26216|nr:hypothetical protein [Tessaracoccus sp.]MBK7819591.1 hypothetical protein [Tessaracoccus sp.]
MPGNVFKQVGDRESEEGFEIQWVDCGLTEDPVANEVTAGTPTISGTVRVGSTLSAVPGDWGPTGVAVSYQWLRAGTEISGATAATYKLVAADQGRKISVKVTGAYAGYRSVSKTSAETVAVAAAMPPVGSLTAPTPRITGTVAVGKKLTAKPGTWRPSGVKLAYQWLRSGKAIRKATTSTYTLVAADKGKKISVRVTGSKPMYASASKVSKSTTAVKVGKLTATPVPKITGTAKVGKTLKAKAGKWKPATVELSYQWQRDGKKIKGATKSSYKLAKADKGRKITVKVKGSESGFTSVTKTSKATAKVK